LSHDQPVRIAIAGALGRMGKAVALAAAGRPDVAIAARFDREGVEGEGLVPLSEALSAAQVVIDFTTPAASVQIAERAARQAGLALVVGSTGFSAEQDAAIAKAAASVAIVKAGNYSLGVNMLMGLVRQAAAALPANMWDIEVFEAHHRRKVDAPSGTAKMLGNAAAKGRGADYLGDAPVDRNGVRQEGQIGYSVLRAGGIIGDHSVSFVSDNERLVLSHVAQDRGLFADGALAAALWVRDKPAGLYDMQDVLGFARG
jgi:4-hydroxy-tetrahydrodipicolinate reductase